jgi:signal transduction histidine kinase
VLAIVESHGGYVEMETVAGEGSTFTVALPADGAGGGLE